MKEIGIYISYPNTFWNHGGGETVFKKTIEYGSMNKNFNFIKISSPEIKKPDLLHIIGSNHHVEGLGNTAKNLGIKVVVSSIWFSKYSNLILSLSKIAKYFPLDNVYKQRLDVFKNADIIIANSQIEKKQVNLAFNIDNKKIKVIHLGVDDSFYRKKDLFSFEEKYGVRDYILCVARIYRRKNQVMVADIAESIGRDVVFIGSLDPSDLQYQNDFKGKINAINKRKRIKAVWINTVPHDSDILKSAYKNAAVHVLASQNEFPGLSSLEAGISGTNIVVAEAPTVREYFGNYAYYCKYNNRNSIKNAIEEALSNKKKAVELQMYLLNTHTWQNYINKVIKIYNQLLF
ncbi:glycosyltransferase [Clostridium tyrobutyricum]|uniref:glycosyltransferase n=1 Tax=Clostridium tyrobutyricum TaxID=1519 RepID=UPI002430DCC4|nr:glycosyltransferase [Clostridium tyrobutyricum]